MVLPTKKSGVDNRWQSQKFAMIGPAGCGKSEFWSHGDKTLYIQTEAGLNHLEVMKVVVQCWEDFRNVAGLLIQANEKGEFPYDTIVIDTIDRLKDCGDQEAVARGKEKYAKLADSIHGIGDIPNGTGWMWSTQLIDLALSKLESLPCALVYIGHLATKEVKGPTSSYHRQTISIGGKTGEILCAWPDHFLSIEAELKGDKTVRKVRTMPTATVEAKSRGGIIMDGWLWDENSKVNYDKLRSKFN